MSGPTLLQAQLSPLLDTARSWLADALPSVPMYLHMCLGLALPIYAGAHASLSRPSSAAEPPKRPATSDGVDDDDGEEEEEVQELIGWTTGDIVFIPLTAAALLAGLYYIITRYGADLLGKVLGWYYALVGMYSIVKIFSDGIQALERFVFPDYYLDAGRVWRAVAADRKIVVIGAGGDAKGMVRTSPLASVFGRLPLPGSVLSALWSVREKGRQGYVVKGYMPGEFDFRKVMTRASVSAAFLGLAMVILGTRSQPPWWYMNLQLVAITYLVLQTASPTSFRIGSLVLLTLLVYDIVMVFYTPLMETVAKGLVTTTPAMMQFPGPLVQSAKGESFARQTRMIGGGDIMIPGLMIALALRFDLYMFYLKKQKTTTALSKDSKDPKKQETVEKAPYVSVSRLWVERVWTLGAKQSSLPDRLSGFFPKVYFTASMIGYFVGIGATMAVLRIWKRGQPALLYLVPTVLISLWGTALIRGELKHMWDFTEGISAEQLEAEGTGTPKDKKEDKSADDSESQTWTTWLWSNVLGEPYDKNAKDKDNDAGSDEKSREPAAGDKPASPKKSSRDPELVFSFTIRRRNISAKPKHP